MTRLVRAQPLLTASIAFVAANLIHTADHLRQGVGELTSEILAGGSVLTVLAFVVLGLVLRASPRAPLFAAVVGVQGAVGIAAAHIAPHWSALSDSYSENGADVLSWIVMLGEVGAAAWLGVAGLLEIRRRAGAPSGQVPQRVVA